MIGDLLTRKLETLFTLSDPEREAVQNLPVHQVDIKKDQDIVREGDRPSRSFIVLEGVTCTYKLAGDGKRQIVAFHIPGDAPDLQSLHLKTLDISIGSITPCRIGFVRHEAIRDLCGDYPRIAAALWRSTLIDAAIFREWMTSIGRRNAHVRIAHLMCEMVVRFQAVKLANDHEIAFPISQSEIADALGLSHVHVNRSIQDIRAQGLITLRDGRLRVLDWEGLQTAGDFDAAYLHLEDDPAAA